MGITSNGLLKEGVVYVDTTGKQTNNSTLYNAFMNKAFLDKWNDETVQSQLNDGISTTYADLEESDYTAAIINAYFNLLDDKQPNYFNGGASLSRAEAMAILMRAVTPVEELKANDTFKNLVGDNEYTAYASYMDSNCFINSSDKSINTQTFTGAMTRAEFVYMVMNQTFGKETVSKFDDSQVSLNDCKNAGNIAEAEKFSGKDYCNSYVVNQMVKNPDAGVTTEIYKALAMAKSLGIIGGETRWDESISKTEGIELIISAFEAYVNLNGSKVEVESGETNRAEYIAEAEAEYEALSATLAIYMKKEEAPTENPTESPSQADKDEDIYYIDENGYVHLKDEYKPKDGYVYKYREEILNASHAIAFFKSLGYKLNDTVTADEVRAIHKDFPNAMTSAALEESLGYHVNIAIYELACSVLPSNPNATPDKPSSSGNEGGVVIEGGSYIDPSPVKPGGYSSGNNPNYTPPTGGGTDERDHTPDIPDDVNDNLTPDDNIFE